jgi:hypothetical protein
LTALATSTLVVPAIASAKVKYDESGASSDFGSAFGFQQRNGMNNWNGPWAPVTNVGSLGGGMMNGNEPGHVTSGNATKIDNDTRGIVNDIQVGRGTDDTQQSKNPPPAR